MIAHILAWVLSILLVPTLAGAIWLACWGLCPFVRSGENIRVGVLYPSQFLIAVVEMPVIIWLQGWVFSWFGLALWWLPASVLCTLSIANEYGRYRRALARLGWRAHMEGLMVSPDTPAEPELLLTNRAIVIEYRIMKGEYWALLGAIIGAPIAIFIDGPWWG